MKNIFSTLIFLFIFCFKGQTQNITPRVFVVENNSTTSKETILKTEKLNISDTSLLIESFAYVITGKRTDGISQPAYGINKGKDFSHELLNDITNFKSNHSSLLLTDIIVKDNFKKSRKLNQNITINF